MPPAKKFDRREFNNFIEALREHPQWLEELRRLILTTELLELPRKFEEFLKEFNALRENVNDFRREFEEFREKEFYPQINDLKERFEEFREKEFDPLKVKIEKIEEDVGVLKEDVSVLKKDVSVLKEDVGVLKEDVSVLKEDVGVLKEDVSVLKEEVNVLKENVANLNIRVSNLEQDVAILKQDVSILKIDVGDLKGDNFERKVREKAPAYFGRLLKKIRVVSIEELSMTIDTAEEKGIITEEEREEGLRVDVVIIGELRTKKRKVISAIEVSVKADRVDVERAFFRGKILEKAFGLPAISITIGKEFTEGAEERAVELGVILVRAN